MNKTILLAAALFLGLQGAVAQTTPAQIAANPCLSAGIYHSYEYRPGTAAPVPEGYAPFYISHYGRHGCRWHATPATYNEPLEVLRKAAAAGALTPKGADLLTRVEVAAADAEGRYGDLSPRGVAEHRGIAERMFAAYPQVFASDNGRVCRIQSRSTIVPRCILSMAAFNERLKELNPAIQTTRESSERYMSYLSNRVGMRAQGKAASAVADSLRDARLDPTRLMASIFSNPEFIQSEVHPGRMLSRLYLLASIMQDVSYLNISFYDLFTPEELYDLWYCDNVRRYLEMGPSKRFGDPIVADAKPLLRNIVEEAEAAIDGRSGLAVSLRFGHDVNVIPLVALMGVKGASARVDIDQVHAAWSIERVSPMGTNVQLIFFRNKAGDIRVRVLHNERDAELPLAGGPYYSWPALRDYFCARYQ